MMSNDKTLFIEFFIIYATMQHVMKLSTYLAPINIAA